MLQEDEKVVITIVVERNERREGQWTAQEKKNEGT